MFVTRLNKAYGFLQQAVNTGLQWMAMTRSRCLLHLHAPTTNCTLTHSSQNVYNPQSASRQLLKSAFGDKMKFGN